MSLYLPIGLLYLAACLREYSVAVYDQRVSDLGVFEKLLSENPVCAGFSIMTGIQIRYALDLAEVAKERGVPTVFGGVHATILPDQTRQDPRVDYVVVGEGELAFRALVEQLLRKENAESIQEQGAVDLNAVAHLPLDLVDIENYVHTAGVDGRSLPFLFSRGCPYKCTFCCNPVISNSRWRAMDVDIALEELDTMVNRFALDGIFFFDENLTANPRVLERLAAGIGGRFGWTAQSRVNVLLKYDLAYLHRMGLRRVSCGIESGSPRVLKAIRKAETVDEYVEANRRLARTGINAWYNYIVGFPSEDIDDVKRTVGLALQLLDENPHANNNTFYLLTPYPGTEIGDRYLKASMPDTLEGWADFGRYNFAADWHSPEMLALYSRICFSSKFVGKRILSAFPDDDELEEMTGVFTEKWRRFDFYDDGEWDELEQCGWGVLKRLFGEYAY